MKYVFPTLYLKTDKGNIRFWEIWVVGRDKGPVSIYTKFGLKGGKVIQPYPQIIEKGMGKKSAYDRAIQLATTKWSNRIKKGYKAEKPKITPLIAPTVKYEDERSVIPMRAYSLADHEVIYPAYVQPKIDGYRALLHKDDGKYKFLSMTGREYQHLGDMMEDLKKIKELNNKNFYLDGELYLEGEQINLLRSVLSTIELTAEQKKIVKKIKYYVFDLFDLKKMDMNYRERYDKLLSIFKNNFKHLVLTPTNIIRNEKELDAAFDKYVKEGYEGIIIRNMRGTYKLRGKSMNVLKSKNVKKNKFIISGYKESTGNNRGTVVWKIKCKNNPNKFFWAKPMGSRDERRKMFKNAEKYVGQEVMVKYFEIDNEGCVTKNPVAYFNK